VLEELDEPQAASVTASTVTPANAPEVRSRAVKHGLMDFPPALCVCRKAST
jgi:hypothetical protein